MTTGQHTRLAPLGDATPGRSHRAWQPQASGNDAVLAGQPAGFATATGRRVFLAGAGALALMAAGCLPSQSSLSGLNGVDVSDVDFGRAFSLTDSEGATRTLAEFKGRAVLVFFGFTQCPDVCPTALMRAAEVKQLLGADAARLQVVFVTVDPERDTPEILKAYTEAFHPDFLGLYGTKEQTDATVREFKVFYQKVPTGTSYTIDHTALSYAFDAQGKLRVILKHEQTAQQYADDLRQLLALG
jgi:protein SCO1/2